jgi:hypothetical protein
MVAIAGAESRGLTALSNSSAHPSHKVNCPQFGMFRNFWQPSRIIRPGRRTEANTRRKCSHIFVIIEAHRSMLTAWSAPLETRVPTMWHILSEQSLAQSKVKSPNEIDSSKPVDAQGSACAFSTLEALARQTSGGDARVWHLRLLLLRAVHLPAWVASMSSARA